MSYFIARQPILDRNQKLFGYELLFRRGFDNFYDQLVPNPDFATVSVISDSLMQVGLNNFSKSNKSFINFTKNLIVDKVPFSYAYEKFSYRSS